MQHLQSLKTEEWKQGDEYDDDDDDDGWKEEGKGGKKEGKTTEWTSDFILKGHRHHCCIILQPTRDSRVSQHLYQRDAIEH